MSLSSHTTLVKPLITIYSLTPAECTRKFHTGGSANGHYSGNGEFYMQVGDEMGKAMVELLKK